MYKRVAKKKSLTSRQRAEKLINDVRKKLKSKYKFATRLVGSAQWGTIIEDIDGTYDLDYQILLTKNSKKFKENRLANATNIKNDFYNSFQSCVKQDERLENSTTAITLINREAKYSIDFVIIKYVSDPTQIIRRNNTKENPCKNSFSWNTLPNFNKAYMRFKSLNGEEKRDLIENFVIPKKYKEKQKDESDPKKLSSCQLFIREVNNYVSKKSVT